MAARNEFRAPWSRELFVMSAIFSIMIGVPIAINVARGHRVISVILLAVFIAPAVLTVRGYQVLPHELRVRRLFWANRWPLSPNTVARVHPGAMERSWRLFGNGGVFAFAGTFSNASLGRFYALVTDSNRTVVLETPHGRLVVSPDDPDEFVAAVVAATNAER
jgi:hypothetical protein